MKAIFLLIILASFSDARVLKFDFRDSHVLQKTVGAMTELRLLEDKGKYGKEYFASDVQVEIFLPGGQVITGDLEHLGISVFTNGVISNFRMQGPPMPVDEAYRSGKILYSAFSIPHGRLEAWRPNAGSGRDVTSVMDGNGRTYYPSINIEIRPSMSERYPLRISFELSWNILRDDDRDESWGKANNPKPPPGLDRVSLNPPSGRKYDRLEEIHELNERSAEFDRRIGQVRGPDNSIIRENKRPQVDKRSQYEPENPSLSDRSFWNWTVIAAIGLAGLSIWRLLKRR
ncbi:hypothetical protein HQ447_00010 [bacterium]|nr:hypothetical protein [bacterium]